MALLKRLAALVVDELATTADAELDHDGDAARGEARQRIGNPDRTGTARNRGGGR